MDKMYNFKAHTHRHYILVAKVSAVNEIEARKIVYGYILDHREELNYNPNLFLKIELKEVKE